jgi:hypothetical protein
MPPETEDDLLDKIEEALRDYPYVYKDISDYRDKRFDDDDVVGDIEYMGKNLRKWRGRIDGEEQTDQG